MKSYFIDLVKLHREYLSTFARKPETWIVAHRQIDLVTSAFREQYVRQYHTDNPNPIILKGLTMTSFVVGEVLDVLSSYVQRPTRLYLTSASNTNVLLVLETMPHSKRVTFYRFDIGRGNLVDYGYIFKKGTTTEGFGPLIIGTSEFKWRGRIQFLE